MKVCFVLTHVPNPRMNKRIEVFKNAAEVAVICTRRSSQNIWEPSQEVEHVIFNIDLPTSSHIVKRYFVSKAFQRKGLKCIEERKPNVLYCEGLDSLIIAEKYKRTENAIVFLEVADLRENYLVKPTNLFKRLVTNMLLYREKKLFEFVDYLVVTSPKFYESHYVSLISSKDVIYLPNMPNPEVFACYRKKTKGKFTIGFIGAIRYLRQMRLLVDLANEMDIEVMFAGAIEKTKEHKEFIEYCNGLRNVSFTGKYNYDKDIAELYGKVNCVYSVYDADNPNVQIALPNKLYESILCGLPIIVAKGTYLSELVEEWGVGVSVYHESSLELKNAINRLKNDTKFYNSLVDNCKNIAERFLEKDWSKDLRMRLERYC